jgi:predicted secreted protein
MTKKDKREKRRKQRLDEAMNKAFAATNRKCPKCGRSCYIGTIDGYVTCVCGEIVRRFS